MFCKPVHRDTPSKQGPAQASEQIYTHVTYSIIHLQHDSMPSGTPRTSHSQNVCVIRGQLIDHLLCGGHCEALWCRRLGHRTSTSPTTSINLRQGCACTHARRGSSRVPLPRCRSSACGVTPAEASSKCWGSSECIRVAVLAQRLPFTRRKLRLQWSPASTADKALPMPSLANCLQHTTFDLLTTSSTRLTKLLIVAISAERHAAVLFPWNALQGLFASL